MSMVQGRTSGIRDLLQFKQEDPNKPKTLKDYDIARAKIVSRLAEVERKINSDPPVSEINNYKREKTKIQLELAEFKQYRTELLNSRRTWLGSQEQFISSVLNDCIKLKRDLNNIITRLEEYGTNKLKS